MPPFCPQCKAYVGTPLVGKSPDDCPTCGQTLRYIGRRDHRNLMRQFHAERRAARKYPPPPENNTHDH